MMSFDSFKISWRLLRPYQWIKNVFVFTGIFFAHAWNDFSIVVDVISTAFAFCLLSSAIYVFNDIQDRNEDRLHYRKKNRPIAAGIISVPTAYLISGCLLLLAFGIGSTVSWSVIIILGFYFFINLLYSLRLKHVVILDVFCIASGFILRILAGTIGVGIEPSNWLLLCSLMITLFLGFVKRRAEIEADLESGMVSRKVLSIYSTMLLDQLIVIGVACVILSYSLYTMSPETIETHQTKHLIFTVPFIAYAMFRYMYLLYSKQSGGEPSKDLFKDWHIIMSIGCWLILTLFLITS